LNRKYDNSTFKKFNQPVATTGQLGLLSSSERFKDGIEPMGNASEALLSLRPVTFRYKKNIDPKGAPQFGLVAEQVEKVNPDLVARDAKGEVYTVRYEAVNAMLLNEFLKGIARSRNWKPQSRGNTKEWKFSPRNSASKHRKSRK
jgi:hypothetical protein